MARRKLLLRLLSLRHQPSALVYLIYRGMDMTIKTNTEGIAVAMKVVQKLENSYRHESYFERTLIKDMDGKIIKDCWTLKCSPKTFGSGAL
jgi:hypothetical protein